MIGKPGGVESSDPVMPLVIFGGSFGFTVAAMLTCRCLSEFDVAVGRTSGGWGLNQATGMRRTACTCPRLSVGIPRTSIVSAVVGT